VQARNTATTMIRYLTRSIYLTIKP
jgi:hypothetical protein